MDPKELRGLVEAYSEVYAPQQIDEISQKTATSAYAQRRTGEFEGDDASDRVAKTNKLKGRIEKKFGAKAGEHAEKAADVKTFGRKDASGRRKQSPQPRIQISDHENQREFKRELRIKRDRRLRAARGEDTNEQFDIFDVVLEFLQVEGYAETLEEAEWLMANLIDEEAVDIILGEGHGSRRSFKTQSADERKRVNMFKGSKIEYTPHKNYDPEANRGQGQILRPNQAEKQRRKGLAKSAMGEDFELWVNELIEEGYDLSDYTWDDMYEFYLDEAITSEKGKEKAAEMIAARSTPSGRAKSGQGASVAAIKHIGRSEREGLRGTPMTPTMAKNPAKSRTFSGTGNKAARRAGTYQEAFEAWLDEAMSSYDKNRKRAAARAEERNRLRQAGKLSGPMERISLRDKFGDAAGTRMAKAKPPGPGEKY